MGGSAALDLSVAGLILAVAAVLWFAVEYVLRVRQFDRRPSLPDADLPPSGLRAIRAAEIPAEVEAGLATMIGYLRRRTLHS
jgi:hypothetical protein